MKNNPNYKNKAIWMLTIGVLGFLDATYLAVEHFLNSIPPCSLVSGCEEVLTSNFAVIGGVPVALLGALYYLLIVVMTIVFLDTKNTRVLKIAAKLTILGFIASLGFVYIQLFVLHAICLYCMGSALTSTLLFILGVLVLRTVENTDAHNTHTGIVNR